MVFVGKSDLAPNTFGELVAFAKKQGEKVTFATAGVGSSSQLCALLFMSAIQTKLTQVPYKGGGPLMNDLIGRQVDMGCEQATTATPPVQSKRIKGYAVTTKARLQSLAGPADRRRAGRRASPSASGTPSTRRRARRRRSCRSSPPRSQGALKDPDLIKRFDLINTEPIAPSLATPEALQKHLFAEVERWAPIIKAAGEYAD